MTEFEAALSSFAALDEEALGRPWSLRGQPMDVRYALYRTIEDAQETHVRVVGRPLPESRRILSFAQRAFGDLQGLLVGLPADLIDRAPRAGGLAGAGNPPTHVGRRAALRGPGTLRARACRFRSHAYRR